MTNEQVDRAIAVIEGAERLGSHGLWTGLNNPNCVLAHLMVSQGVTYEVYCKREKFQTYLEKVPELAEAFGLSEDTTSVVYWTNDHTPTPDRKAVLIDLFNSWRPK